MKLELTLPVKKFGVNQYFGNPDPKYKELNLPGHNGIDFRAAHGEPILASHDGEAYYEVDNNGGHGVVIIGPEIEFKGSICRFKTICWHLVDSSIEPQYKSPVEGYTANKRLPVARGDVIGYADNTGFSTGSHLHFGLKIIDKKLRTLNYDNGYFGAIDPRPFFIDFPYQFPREMGVGAEGDDVKQLQRFLNKVPFLVAAHGPGAPNNETKFFGVLTKNALKRFQKDWGIWPASGYFGSRTRDIINKIQSSNPLI